MRFSFVLLLLFSTPLLAGQSCDEVVISAHPDYPPFHWQEDGEIIGASIAISSKIFSELNVKHRSAYAGPWKRVLMNAKAGYIDFIPSLKLTTERQRYLQYSDSPFHFNPVAAFVRKNFSRPIKELRDLSGLVGSINLGNKHGSQIDNFVNAQQKVYQVNGTLANFKMLKLGRTDYFLEGLYTGRDILKKHQLEQEFKAATVFDNMQVHSAFSKSSPCSHLLSAYNDKLNELRSSGFVAEQFERYEQLWLASQH